jgi:Zn-finger in ubiquitin-hydrolases and other protein
VQATCSHLDQISSDLPAPLDVCPACVAIGSGWVHLRQCLTCGATNCCDSSPNRHATKHYQESRHPIMQTLEEGEDWAWCFVDRLTMEPEDGTFRVVDPFFEAGLWYAQQAIDEGGSVPFAPGAVAGDGFPLAVWESTYRGRHRAGTLDPDQASDLEALPGWTW